MAELFKRGQIIPKRIGHLSVHRKARHRIVFGSDVWVDGPNLTAVPGTGDSIIHILPIGRKRKNGTTQSVNVNFYGLHLDCKGCLDGINSVQRVDYINTRFL